MYSVRKINDVPNSSLHKEFLVDFESEIKYLPTNIKQGTCNKTNSFIECCAIGSEAFVLDSKSVFILGHDSVWHKI